eukprot:07930.XXX_6901_6306_1 [CDS] Oithona nana genome sequencing.
MMIWIFINFLFLLHNSAAETHLYPPAGCNNCERKLSPFCCAVAWNGICCEYPIADQVEDQEVHQRKVRDIGGLRFWHQRRVIGGSQSRRFIRYYRHAGWR